MNYICSTPVAPMHDDQDDDDDEGYFFLLVVDRQINVICCLPQSDDHEGTNYAKGCRQRRDSFA